MWVQWCRQCVVREGAFRHRFEVTVLGVSSWMRVYGHFMACRWRGSRCLRLQCKVDVHLAVDRTPEGPQCLPKLMSNACQTSRSAAPIEHAQLIDGLYVKQDNRIYDRRAPFCRYAV